MQRRRALEQLELLCSCGAGIEALAAPICEAAREVIGAVSGSLFWFDADGNPAGFYHDSAPAWVKDIFITRFGELFADQSELSMVELSRKIGPSIGRLIEPAFQARMWSGNVYRHLCVPLGHRYCLDIRIEAEGCHPAVMCLWNPEGHPFRARHVERARPVQALLRQSIETTQDNVRWIAQDHGDAHFSTDLSGARLLTIDQDAEKLLMESHLLQQNLSMTGQVRQAPGFATLLAHMLAATGGGSIPVIVANGRLIASCRSTRIIQPSGNDQQVMTVSLRQQVPFDRLCIEYLADRQLTLLQRRLALFAMQGGERAKAKEKFGVSDESLKKHVAAILAELGVGRWQEIAELAAGFI